MTKKIFHSILLVAGAVLLASLFVITGALYEYFGIIQKKQLKDELGLAAVSVEQQGDDFLKRLSPDRYRITWINTQGNVIYDTRTDAESLENHADRTEIKLALKDGYGESIRYSSTLLEKTIYCAQRLTDGSVLRISVSRATIGVLMLGILQPILIVLIAALVLSSMLAKRLSKRIVEPLNSLDLEHPLDNDSYEELSPLLNRINRQHNQITAQMRELKKRTDQFAQITASMNEGLVLLDNRGCILSINPAAIEIFGAEPSCIGRDFLSVDRSHDMSVAIHYATRVVVPHLGRTLQAVTNIGRKPTFGDYGLSIESFLLDTDLNLYGSELRLDFVARLRDEKRFDSADALVAQIRTDVARARDLLTMYF